MRGSGGQQRPIANANLRPWHMLTQDLGFMPQHQQLDLLHGQAAAAPDKRTQQRPKREAEK
jgi:hypothetical protein